MALTIISAPGQSGRPSIDMINNGVYIKVKTNNRVTTPGTKYSATMTFTGTIVAGQSFTLAWGDKTVTFTAAATPDNSGNQIPSGNMSSILGISLFVYLCRNYDLFRDFIPHLVSADANSTVISLTAVDTGTYYNISCTESITWLTYNQTQAGINKQVRDNFRVLMEVYRFTGHSANSTYQYIASTEQIPDKSETCTFNVAEILKPYCTYDIPSHAQVAISRASNTTQAYFYRVGEVYGDPEDVKEMLIPNRTAPVYAWNAGIAKEEYKSTQPFSIIGNKPNWLSNQPVIKSISKTQQEYLYYTPFTFPATELQLRVKIYYSDNTTGEGTFLNFNDGIDNQYGMFIVPVGYSNLGLTAYEQYPAKIVKYEVWIRDNNLNIISDKRTYIIDESIYYDERVFLYQNSMGGFETLRTTGGYMKTIEAVHDTTSRILPFQYTNKDVEVKKTDIGYDKIIEVSTGYLDSQAWKNSLQQLLYSEHVFEIIGGDIRPIIVLTKKDDLFLSNETLWSFRFQYKYAYNNIAYGSL